MNPTKASLILLGALFGACGGPSSDDQEAVTSGHDTTQAQQQPLALSDELFAFDPTLDPSRTVPENVVAITSRAQSTLAPCAAITATATSVTITAPTAGCTTSTGLTWSGTLTAAVSKSGSTLSVALSWANVVLNGSTYAGSTTFSTSTGNVFAVTFALTRDGKSVTGTLTVTGAPGQLTTSGALNNGATSAVFTNVVWKLGECYPDAGTLAVTVGRLTTTYTFSASTPTTGTITTAKGQTAQLPAYGACPPSADGGK